MVGAVGGEGEIEVDGEHQDGWTVFRVAAAVLSQIGRGDALELERLLLRR